jgi:hypothetical protein
MVHGVNGPNGINNDIKIKLNNVETQATGVNSTWGDGFATTNGVGIERNIAGLDTLLEKFGFDTPAYEKNIAQLSIDDRYYIPDQPFVEHDLCEV